MASFRTVLDTCNMDVVMYLVRKLNKNPSEVMNMLLLNPQLIYDARSEINEREKEGLTCKK